MFSLLEAAWLRFWMLFAGYGFWGRMATRIATWFAPPYKARRYVADIYRKGYISPSAIVCHDDLRLGDHVFIGDRVVIYKGGGGGSVELGDRVTAWADGLLETGEGGRITMGPETRINPGVKVVSYKAPIHVGRDVGLGSYCCLYSYDHGLAADDDYMKQPLKAKGAIVIGDHAMLGLGVIVLSGVQIGKGAVVAAGSVVKHDVPDGAVVAGVPAKVVKMRSDKP